MAHVSLFESVPNFSEGRRDDVIGAIAGAAQSAYVLDRDSDADHNRAVITLAGAARQLEEALLGAAEAAQRHIDVSTHQGVHPRVGAVDVIPIVPLEGASLDDAREVARAIGQRLWHDLDVPVYFYGYGASRSLADIRSGRATPDLGGPDPHPTAGAACVGARDLLLAFNVLLPRIDLFAARALARSLRESAGGMRGVQALAFQLPSGAVQLSMNLFRLGETTPVMVTRELVRRGVELGQEEVVGLCPAKVAVGAAAGRLLEGRLASAAARAGARLVELTSDEEHQRLAAKLGLEADALATLGPDQTELLVGAERAAALIPVLRAAGISEPTLESMLRVGARRLRDSLTAFTATGNAARVEALDRRLAGLRPGA